MDHPYKRDLDLIILPANKRCATVVLDLKDYEKKLQAMLDDPQTYQKITKDPTPHEQRMNAVLQSINKEGAISDKLYPMLQSSAGRTPSLYVLPKIHKPGVPHQPYVSFIQSPHTPMSY